jgi:hypothetical protein
MRRERMGIAAPFLSAAKKGDSRTGEAFTVEVLGAYSHPIQAVQLRLCHTATLISPCACPETERAESEENARPPQ